MKLLHAMKRQDVGLEVFDQDSKQITAYRKNISNILVSEGADYISNDKTDISGILIQYNDGFGKCPKNTTSPPRCHSNQVDPLVFL